MREITVPFHFALSSQNSNKARDMHLFKKLKTFLREEDFENDKLINEITNMCMDLKTNEIRLQTIEMLMCNKHVTPDALLAAAHCFSKQLDLQGTYKLFASFVSNLFAKIIFKTSQLYFQRKMIRNHWQKHLVKRLVN